MMKRRIDNGTDVRERVVLCRILEKIRKNEDYARSVGITNNTWLKNREMRKENK